MGSLWTSGPSVWSSKTRGKARTSISSCSDFHTLAVAYMWSLLHTWMCTYIHIIYQHTQNNSEKQFHLAGVRYGQGLLSVATLGHLLTFSSWRPPALSCLVLHILYFLHQAPALFLEGCLWLYVGPAPLFWHPILKSLITSTKNFAS